LRGRGGSSGPGRGGPVPPAMMGRGTPLAATTPDGREIHHKGPPCASCNEMIIGACVNAFGKTYLLYSTLYLH
jgi:hypothetical protein